MLGAPYVPAEYPVPQSATVAAQVSVAPSPARVQPAGHVIEDTPALPWTYPAQRSASQTSTISSSASHIPPPKHCLKSPVRGCSIVARSPKTMSERLKVPVQNSRAVRSALAATNTHPFGQVVEGIATSPGTYPVAQSVVIAAQVSVTPSPASVQPDGQVLEGTPAVPWRYPLHGSSLQLSARSDFSVKPAFSQEAASRSHSESHTRYLACRSRAGASNLNPCRSGTRVAMLWRCSANCPCAVEQRVPQEICSICAAHSPKPLSSRGYAGIRLSRLLNVNDSTESTF